MFAQGTMQLSIGYIFGSGSASLGITVGMWRGGFLPSFTMPWLYLYIINDHI